MSGSDDTPGDSFRGLILQLRGRIGLTQRELAARLDVHHHSIQAWEAGTSYPGATSLRALIAAAVYSGGFTSGDVTGEATALWAAAVRESPRLRTPFDRTWFDGLLNAASMPEHRDSQVEAGPAAVAPSRPVQARRQSWGEAPDVVGFVGRAEERERLCAWVLDDRCRMMGVYGLAGIGKTLLAARLAHDVAPHFEYVYWRSLRDAPAPGEWLAAALAFLAPDDASDRGEAAQAMRLLDVLSRSRCLLVLDNFETVLTTETHSGSGASSHAGYAGLLRQLGEVPHQSCILLTSREAPAQLEMMRGERSPVRSLHLTGLGVRDGQHLLSDKGLDGDTGGWQALVAACGGNGLALKVTGETIRDLFGGSIMSYLEFAASTPGLLIGGLRQMLSVQMERLSELERHLLRWLAVERQPVSFSELASELGPRTGRGAALEAIDALRRRSLLERGERPAGFTLHPVIMEYVTERLIAEIAEEIRTGDLDRLLTQPLVKATARDYVRRSQERLIATPLLEQLRATAGGTERVEARLLELLERLRGRSSAEHGYGPGNLVNLLRLSRGNLRRIDLSRLEIRQAFLQGVEAQDASLAGARLSEVVLADAFKYPTSVTLSADGTYLAAGTSAGEVCLWRVADRALLATFPGHAAGVRGVALSRDNRVVASSSYDGTVRLWDTGQGLLLAILRGHEGLVYAVALSDDGQLVASSGQDGTVKLWETGGGRLLLTLPVHEGGVWGVALSGDGRLAASGSSDGAVRLWDAGRGELLRTLEGHTSSVLGVSLSRDGRLVVSGSYDGTVRVWETGSGQLVRTLDGAGGGIRDVALSADGEVVASGGFDNAIRIWDVGSGQLVALLLGHLGIVYSVALSHEGDTVASGSFDGSVKLWEIGSGQILANLQGYNRSIRSVSLSRDGRLILSSSFEGPLRLWDAESGQLLRTLRGHATGVRDVALSLDGRYAASGSYDGVIHLWDVASGQPLRTLSGPTGGVWGIALSGDTKRVAAGAYDGSIVVWSFETGRPIQTLAAHRSGVRDVALSADGRLLASGSEDTTVRLWDVESGRLLATFDDHTGGIWSVALSADARLVASASDDKTIRVWDAATGRQMATLTGHTNAVWGVALSQDGRRLASASFDGTVRFWDLETGDLLTTLRGHDDRVTGVALSADGGVVASAGVDGTVGVWETAGGSLRQMLLADRRYERMDVTDLTGVNEAQRDALLVLGAVDRASGEA